MTFNNDIFIFVLHGIGNSGTFRPPNMSGKYKIILHLKKKSESNCNYLLTESPVYF